MSCDECKEEIISHIDRRFDEIINKGMKRSSIQVLDMPKLEAPFRREDGACVPVIPEEHRWVFTSEALATDKLDGTNVSIVVEDARIRRVFNRTNEIPFLGKGSGRFIEGINKALERKYLIPSANDGQFFGELIGEQVQGNPYKLDGHLWVPFSYMKKKYYYKFWPEFVKELAGKTDEEIFQEVSTLFKGLWSIYKRQRGFETTEVNESIGFTGLAAEGIVFHSKDGKMAKLRRDMFSWFTRKGGR